MDSPKENVAAAAVDNNQTIQAVPSSSSTATDLHDMPLASGDDRGSLNSHTNSSAGPEQKFDADGQPDERSQLDCFFKSCEKLPRKMRNLSLNLKHVVLRRAMLQNSRSYRSLLSVETFNDSEEMLRYLRTKLRFEKEISKRLNDVQARYKSISSTIQTTLEMHDNIVKERSCLVDSADLKLTTDALRWRLEKNAAISRQTVRILLHTVYLSDSELDDHLLQNCGFLTSRYE